MVNIPIDDQHESDQEVAANEEVNASEVEAANSETGEDEAVDALASAQAETAQAKEQLLRLAADFENYKRQAARREVETKERAVKNVLGDLLPVLDNFERAVHASSSTQDVQNLRIGVEFILQQLHEVLRGHGVEPIEAAGKPFNPQEHEAVEQVPSSEHAAGTVIDEAQRGYRFNGQVLRASLVKVASEASDAGE